jgi:hypothetical protein
VSEPLTLYLSLRIIGLFEKEVKVASFLFPAPEEPLAYSEPYTNTLTAETPSEPILDISATV